MSGNRGLPGGGATTGSAVDTSATAYASACASSRRIHGAPGLILAGALAIRVLYTVLVAQDIPVIGDALTYHLLGENIADGKGFERALHPQLAAFESWPPGTPTAEHPPLFPLLIGLFTKLGATGYLAQKLLLCGVGTATVAFVGPGGPRGGGSDGRASWPPASRRSIRSCGSWTAR